MKGKFVPSWFELAQSLTVAPQNLIAVYQASGSLGEFHNGIIKLKPPVTKKAKEISRTVSEGSQAREESFTASQDVGNSVDVQKVHTTPLASALETEVSDLRAMISEKDHQIADLQDLLEKKNQEISNLDDAVNSLRRFLGKIRLNLEMKTPHGILFEMISKE